MFLDMPAFHLVEPNLVISGDNELVGMRKSAQVLIEGGQTLWHLSIFQAFPIRWIRYVSTSQAIPEQRGVCIPLWVKSPQWIRISPFGIVRLSCSLWVSENTTIFTTRLFSPLPLCICTCGCCRWTTCYVVLYSCYSSYLFSSVSLLLKRFHFFDSTRQQGRTAGVFSALQVPVFRE